ncbi:hypothetical protein ACLOJK_033195 [Asimina triloba]
MEKTTEEQKEVKIPFLTVLKNGVILKNIFLNSPRSLHESRSSKEARESGEKLYKEEEKLLVGRHPDCHIVLDHPSISRFHLQIISRSSLQRLSVIDLSSVHGTWVCGRKIGSQIAVDMVEGDTLRLGASTRFYELHWVPWSQAFETEKPFIPASQAPQEEEETSENEDVLSPVKKQNDVWTGSIPSAPPMHVESMNSSSPDEVLSDAKRLTKRENLNLEGPLASLSLFEAEQCSPERRMPEQSPIARHWAAILGAESVSSSVPVEILSAAHVQLEREDHSPERCFNGEVLLSDNRENESPPVSRSEKSNKISGIWSRRCKSVSFLRIQTRRGEEKVDESIDDVIEVEDQKENTDVENYTGGELLGKVLFEESYQSDKENLTPASVGLKSRKGGVEKLQMELQQLASNEEVPYKIPFTESYPSDKENITPITSGRLKSKKFSFEMRHVESQKLSLKGIVVDMDLQADIFPSDRENLTPNPSRDSKLKKPIPKSHQRIQDMLKRNATRLPFQPLVISTDKSKSLSGFHPSPRNSNSVNHSQISNGNNSTSVSQSVDQIVHNLGEGKRKWNMVVDTSTLLDEESRKSLKLLEGLKGTHLIIPRMVVRELDCLRRRGSRFRRGNEASSILQWIEECMVKTMWWIHVQSSAESVATAPTPPASPQSRLSSGTVELPAGTTSSVPFSSYGSLMEIVSPTAEDHILECALLFKRIKEDGQLVLLSNDVALKIKAMAEGLICETAKEFRDSLVNPCSKRFMWVESTPIGPTWSSSSDDAGLKENYVYRPPATRKAGKATEGAKGLKLILLHNSQYGQLN